MLSLIVIHQIASNGEEHTHTPKQISLHCSMHYTHIKNDNWAVLKLTSQRKNLCDSFKVIKWINQRLISDTDEDNLQYLTPPTFWKRFII